MSPTIAERFRERLAALRKIRGVTQEDLEARIGKSQSEKGYISRLETGGIETPPSK
jgi:transcriptional regulator with XRE-family HTH domain